MHIDKKLEFLHSFNLDIAFIIPFDIEFSKISALDFLNDIIVEKFNPQKLLLDTIITLAMID